MQKRKFLGNSVLMKYLCRHLHVVWCHLPSCHQNILLIASVSWQANIHTMAKTPRQKKKSSTKAKCSPVPSNLDRYPPEPWTSPSGGLWNPSHVSLKNKAIITTSIRRGVKCFAVGRRWKDIWTWKRLPNLQEQQFWLLKPLRRSQPNLNILVNYAERVIARIFSYFKARPLSRLDMFTKTADRICSHHRQVERQQLEWKIYWIYSKKYRKTSDRQHHPMEKPTAWLTNLKQLSTSN